MGTNEVTLPQDYYNSSEELDSLIRKHKGKILNEAQLYPALEMLTFGVETVFYANQNFPDEIITMLTQVLSPLWKPDEYEGVFLEMLKKSEEQPADMKTAEALDYIRKLYMKDKGFILDAFHREIEYFEEGLGEQKFELFSGALKAITIEHVNDCIGRTERYIDQKMTEKETWQNRVKPKVKNKLQKIFSIA